MDSRVAYRGHEQGQFVFACSETLQLIVFKAKTRNVAFVYGRHETPAQAEQAMEDEWRTGRGPI